MSSKHLLLLGVVSAAAACSPAPETATPLGGGGKADTGWVASDTYELGAELSSALTHLASGAYAELATNRRLQEELIDVQLKYAKNALKKHGYQLNQLADEIRSIAVSEDGGRVTLTYRAAVDMIARRSPSQSFPTLEEIEDRELTADLPLDPVGVYDRAGEDCARDWSPYTLSEQKYYYYFASDKEGCGDKLELTEGQIRIETVYPDRTAYPEYDQLLRDLGGGTLGFTAALLPTDDNGQTQFEEHKTMIEERLGLKETLEELESGKINRYTWTGPDGAVARIDLYNPAKYWAYWSTFHEASKTYDVVYYDGHSNYGTYDIVNDESYFHDRYQIMMLDGCRSYTYYARQYFKAKGGFEKADMVGTGESAPFYVASRVSYRLLRGLIDGVAALQSGEEDKAPSWQAISAAMNGDCYDVLYGAAGVRDNDWQPTQQPAPE